MKFLQAISMLCGVAACVVISLSILSDWNDALFLPLGLALSAPSLLLGNIALLQEKAKEKKR